MDSDGPFSFLLFRAQPKSCPSLLALTIYWHGLVAAADPTSPFFTWYDSYFLTLEVINKKIDKKPIRRESRSWFFFGSKRTPSKQKKSETETESQKSSETINLNPNAQKSNSYKPRKLSTEQLNNNNVVNFGKTLELTSDQLKKLNLKYGKNEIRYEVFTMLQEIFETWIIARVNSVRIVSSQKFPW